MYPPNLTDLSKVAAAAIGTISTYKGGSKWRKVSASKWVKFSETKTETRRKADVWRKAHNYFDYAMASSKKGTEYRRNPDKKAVTPELVPLKPSMIKKSEEEDRRLEYYRAINNTQVTKMLENGTAVMDKGTINPKRKWVLPTKAEDIELTYKGDSLNLTVKQVQKRKDKRGLVTAGIEIGGTSTAIGAGEANTEAIVTALGTTENYAARLCYELEMGGYSGWFLPSRDELGKM